MTEARAMDGDEGSDDNGVVNLLHRRVAGNVRAEKAYYRDRQSELAKVVGLSQQQLSQRMNDRTPFTLDDIGALAAHWGVTPGELVDGLPSWKKGRTWAPWDSNPQPAD